MEKGLSLPLGVYVALWGKEAGKQLNSNLDSYRRGPIDGVRGKMTGLVM